MRRFFVSNKSIVKAEIKKCIFAIHFYIDEEHS